MSKSKSKKNRFRNGLTSTPTPVATVAAIAAGISPPSTTTTPPFKTFVIPKAAPHVSRQPSKELKQKVVDAFNADSLADMCVRTDFSNFAELHELPGYERFYYYQDNGSDILAIAHLDSVQSDVACQVTSTAGGWLATSGALDDRLGAYVILDLLPRLGIKCDILLTTDEESCRSTAQDFDTGKNYNWMFQFDRGGTDVVMYEYETKELRGLVEDAGARVGVGSFSDICQLDHLGCAGFNWGVGYQDYHGPRSHAWLDDTFKMVARFVQFYDENATKKFSHHPQPKYKWNKDTSGAWLYPKSDDLVDDAPPWSPSTNFGKIDPEWIAADCGHDVDIEDKTTYVEVDTFTIVCPSCATNLQIPKCFSEAEG